MTAGKISAIVSGDVLNEMLLPEQLKGTVPRYTKILSSFNHSHVITNVFDYWEQFSNVHIQTGYVVISVAIVN